ncbi:GPO family capsid scaffolding protein [Laribacter hongkongensis]|uniref:GPO family capsid scaffolding protein n=1 Tax=Laribacter hongkongensis TaxID=168471 RepID=UPI0003FF65F6|nr:GPO family capsid scaffolding protein [Laribacter hongkongensis]
MAKKSKAFRVATEGATTDGREIRREWIEQMARNYDPAVFGARVNIDHIKGILPDSPFRRYGDVTALEAREVEDGKLALFATIDPTDELVALTRARQKIYSSIEVVEKFADSGEAYLVGLAVTDDPASLGTEMLQFCARAEHNPLAGRKSQPGSLFTAAVPVELEFVEAAAPVDAGKGLFATVKSLLAGKGKTDDARFADHAAAIEALAESQQAVPTLQGAVSALRHSGQALDARLQSLTAELADLKARLDSQPQPGFTRQPATGGAGKTETDC